MSLALACLLALSTPPAAEAPAAPGSRALILTGQYDRVDGESGGGGRVDYLELAGDGRGFTLGVAGYDLLGSRWAFGDLGGFLPVGERVTLSAGVALGSGERDDVDFDYETYRLGLSYQAVEGKLVLTAETEYLDIDETRGNLVTAGALVVLSRRVWVEGSVNASTSGNLDSEYALLRIDWRAAGLGWLVGVGGGRSRPEIFDLIGSRESTDIRQAFTGLRIPVGDSELLLLADYLDLDGVPRLTLTASLKLALGKSP